MHESNRNALFSRRHRHRPGEGAPQSSIEESSEEESSSQSSDVDFAESRDSEKDVPEDSGIEFLKNTDEESDSDKEDIASEVSRLHAAIRENNLDAVKCICTTANSSQKRTPIEAMTLVNEEYVRYSALQLAALYGRKEIVEYLLTKQASWIRQNALGMDALMCSVSVSPDNSQSKCTEEQKQAVFELLLSKSPQLANVDVQGKSVLFHSVDAGNFNAFKTLLALDSAHLGAMLMQKVDGNNILSFINAQNREDMLSVLKDRLLSDKTLQLPADDSPEADVDDELDVPADDEGSSLRFRH